VHRREKARGQTCGEQGI